MSLRTVFHLFVALVAGSSVARAAVPPAEPVAFYVAHGAPDSCGPGCERWIAVEGQIDASAAARFRKFLQGVRDRSLPFYFASPGGNLEQALAMGAMLRERGAVTRVGRTVARDCGFEAQDGSACLKLKRSGRALEADLWTRGAMCNSACPYLILGGIRREIAPGTVLGVHSPRVTVSFTGGIPTAQVKTAAVQRLRERADQLSSAYLARMGIDKGLLDLVHTVKFEDVRVLTREEIARFGIDPRGFVETPWIYENNLHSLVYKSVLQLNESQHAFRELQLRLFCLAEDQFELDFLRPAIVNAAAPFHTVAVAREGEAPHLLRGFASKLKGFESWGAPLTRSALQALAEAGQFTVTETVQGSDIRLMQTQTVKMSTEGLATALDKLTLTCASPAGPALTDRSPWPSRNGTEAVVPALGGTARPGAAQ